MSSDVKSKYKWSADNIRTFLYSYINYELLWNVRHADYANKARRESAMKKLKDELVGLGVAVPDLSFLRARVKAIKATYRAEHLKVCESETSGAGADDLYVPKLPWFSVADSFLRDLAISRKTTSNFDNDTPSTSRNYMTTNEMDDLQAEESGQHNVHTNNETPTYPKKRRTTQVECASHTPTSTKVTDEIDLFGKYVAAQLRELPVRNRLICQDRIQSMLTKERIYLLESPNETPFPMLSVGSGSVSCVESDKDDILGDD